MRQNRVLRDHPAEVATIVTPETLLSWHRKLIAQKYDGSSKRGAGRPRTAGELEALVVRLAGENRDWGYRRIRGVLSNLGHEVARSTIAAILDQEGPATLPRAVLHRPGNPQGADWGHCARWQWTLDETGRAKLTDAVDGVFAGKKYLIHVPEVCAASGIGASPA